MAKIIKKGERITKVYYERCWHDKPNCGFGFPCDENGEVFISELEELGLKNYLACINGKFPHLKDRGAVRYEHSYWEPAILKCDCGRELQLDSCAIPDYNRCECGRGYNNSGQELAPPSQWGEETGERFGANGEYLGGGEDDKDLVF